MEVYLSVLLVFVSGIAIVLFGFYAESTARIGRIERKLNLLLRHSGIDPSQVPPLSERVKQLASDPARKIEAIKVYREETGAGLKEAKDAVEVFINSK